MNINRFGFTLIELLIVVAIIAILAAIAIPNFLAAQTRSKVARVKGELRTLATALESYCTDNNEYPHDLLYNSSYFWYVADSITTPVAYISGNYFVDPFRSLLYDQSNYANLPYRRYRFKNYDLDTKGAGGVERIGAKRYGSWRLSSSGPDRTATFDTSPDGWFEDWVQVYDPSNGTVSNGDIIRAVKSTDGSEVFK